MTGMEKVLIGVTGLAALVAVLCLALLIKWAHEPVAPEDLFDYQSHMREIHDAYGVTPGEP